MNKKIDVKKKHEYYTQALPLLVTFTDKNHKEFKTLHYRWVENAMSRSLFHALACKPGTVITISHQVTSLWIASITIKAGGKFIIDSIWDQTTALDEFKKPSQEKDNVSQSSRRQHSESLGTSIPGSKRVGTTKSGTNSRAVH